MTHVNIETTSIPTILTANQKEVLYFRYARGASVEEMAVWLQISRRAVLYRLRSARLRLQCGPRKRRRYWRQRWWIASQFGRLPYLTQDIDRY